MSVDMENSLRRVDIIGVPITATNMDDFVALLKEALGYFKGNYICVSNVHTCVMAHDDPDYWSVQADSIASLPDGKPLSVIGRRRFPSMDRVTGPDLMREMFKLSKEMGWSHYFYGTDQRCLDELKVTLSKQYPWLKIAGMEPSLFRPLSADEEDSVIDSINDSGADFAWIALGAPRQEVFCHKLHERIRPVMIGVGGAFNVLAGIVPEAPRWMQNLSLEWLYRLMQEPRRLFKRYLVTNTKFLVYQFAHIERKKGKR